MHFATIITESHLGFAKAVADSIAAHSSVTATLHCLVVDSVDSRPEFRETSCGVSFYSTESIETNRHFGTMRDKYCGTNDDAFRWSLKPVFVDHLLKRTGEAVAFVDADQFFAGDPSVLFEQLSQSRFLLSPHDRPIDNSFGKMFHTNFTGGLFNGGLFVARPDSGDVLDWWAEQCAYKCEIDHECGLYVDQKYLDVVPTAFKNTDWIRHRGVNVASWNMHTRNRLVMPDGNITVDGDPLICVHFSGSTIRMIDFDVDPKLRSVLADYRATLANYGIDLPKSESKTKPNPEPSPSRTSLMNRLRLWVRTVGHGGKQVAKES